MFVGLTSEKTLKRLEATLKIMDKPNDGGDECVSYIYLELLIIHMALQICLLFRGGLNI